VIAVFDADTGRPAALLDGTAITAMWTGAGSALATRLLAREDAATIAILGTGVQARSHARAVTRVRPFQELRIAGREPGSAEALADELARGRAIAAAPPAPGVVAQATSAPTSCDVGRRFCFAPNGIVRAGARVATAFHGRSMAQRPFWR
jgi:ornithine cyclodeaminase/alanine dehydrogenase-like protein (mu-crystallin family)